MKYNYRVAVTLIETGYIDVVSKNPLDARGKAYDMSQRGAFVGMNVEVKLGDIIETRPYKKPKGEKKKSIEELAEPIAELTEDDTIDPL